MAHRFFGFGGDERQHFVARVQHRVAAGEEHVVVAHDRDERCVARYLEVADRLTGDGRVVGQRDLDEANLAALELEQAHEPPDAHGLVDERGDEMRGRHGEVDAPRLVEEPVVLRVVHPRNDARHRELLLRQQRDDEVVLVVAGRGDDDIAACRPSRRATS